MPYRVCKTIEIENGHMLSKHPDKCRFPHGHTRRVEIVLEADDLDANGMVCDFKIVKTAIGDYLETFDHALCMNTDDPMYATLKAAYGDRVIGFAHIEPTTEVLAKAFFEACAERLTEYAGSNGTRYELRKAVRLARVRVWETSSSWAEYSPHA
jgi:6-pyruvoyltetrahydropterin/6-carboxytetrahydropterin synthase